MMKRLLVICSMLLLFLVVKAQESQDVIIAKINAAVSKIETMQCDFVQTKHMKMLNNKMVSTGIMAYKQNDKLRWEYKKPYAYVFILNGTNVYLKKDSRSDVIDIKRNKVFKSIAEIMMNSVVGKCLSNKSEFKVSILETDSQWVATLIPQKKELKQMYSKITLYFGVSNSIIQRIEMLEKKGDKTIIELKNIELNKPVGYNAFSM